MATSDDSTPPGASRTPPARASTVAVLVVHYKNRALILDNQIIQVLDARKIRHYRVTYSINEKHWWKRRY